MTPSATPAQATDLTHGACGRDPVGVAEGGPDQDDDADDEREQREEPGDERVGVPGVAVDL